MHTATEQDVERKNTEVGVSTVFSGPSVTANKDCQELNHNNGKATKAWVVMFPLMLPLWLRASKHQRLRIPMGTLHPKS